MSLGTISLLMVVVVVMVVGGVEGSECNTTLELSPGELVRLTNPAITEENKGGHYVCWYNINQQHNPLSQPGVIRISVSRLSLNPSPPSPSEMISESHDIIGLQVQYWEAGDQWLCGRLPADP